VLNHHIPASKLAVTYSSITIHIEFVCAVIILIMSLKSEEHRVLKLNTIIVHVKSQTKKNVRLAHRKVDI